MRGAYYNRYNTELSPDERRGLYGFLMDLSMSEGRNAFNDLNDYDMGGAYKASLKERSDKGYFWDLYKKPNHPVFSDDSIYHGVDGHYGGHWTEGTPDIPGGTFIPSEWNLQNMPPEEMKWYFAKYEPEAKLYFPEEGDKGMIHDFRNKSGGGLLDFAMNAAGLVPGMQWLPAAYAGAKAIGSAASGDMGGAVKNGLSAYMGLSGTGGASGGNAPTMTTQMESDPLYISRRLSELNGNDAAGVSANYSPVLRSAGMSPDTSYADASIFNALQRMFGREY